MFFLEAHTYKVAERIHHWVAAFAAIFASTWAFVWQITVMNRPSMGSKVSSGVILVATLGGVIYASKDRIKEIGRAWISGNVHRFYAQRVASWRAPTRRLGGDVDRPRARVVRPERPQPARSAQPCISRDPRVHGRALLAPGARDAAAWPDCERGPAREAHLPIRSFSAVRPARRHGEAGAGARSGDPAGELRGCAPPLPGAGPAERPVRQRDARREGNPRAAQGGGWTGSRKRAG